ncbi:MAG: PIN domain-containing protein [Nitrospinaceae bacterium]|nr:PIN domain nuclease [Nitrospinaceae bacterium]NIR54562.1 PIN domain nuclease [Nitrospinaceae bacterium]NIS84981.1 PIN domain nuclease [Nitrospinaceae bacterium]NIT81792.1 PIN domain nuclease [Nitrospinaceae bacterium]NIU46282.1 PIN domain nuclease [Nitrospinaceae bacterium]
MILADTSVWIDFLKGVNSAHRRALHRLIAEEEDLCLTEIILTEVLQGIRDDKDHQKVKTLLLEFPIYQPKGTGTYLQAADIYRRCRKQGKTVRSTVDCILAAICLEHDLILLHKDRDFDRIQSGTDLKCYPIK